MDDQDIALSVSHLSKTFKLPNEKTNSIREKIFKFGKKQQFEKLQALKDINITVKKGEFLGIVGRNGSGKSTLLKLIGGIYQPTTGKVHVNGTLTPFIELGIGFNPELTGRDNVFLNGAILGLTRKEILKKYDEIVAFAEIEKFMDQKIKNYSSGMQVRLAFSIALQAHNDILLIDEVLAVGDLNFQRKCFDSFREIKKSKKTVIFVTHDMQSVMDFCDRAILISKSEIVKEGDPEMIATEYFKLNQQQESNEAKKDRDTSRWGNEKAEVTSIKVSKITDEKVMIEAECIFNETVDRPVIGFSIKDPHGHKVVESNTLWNKVNTGEFNPGNKAIVTWEVANIFINGQQQITIAIANSNGTEFYDWWDDAISFNINKRMVTSALILPEQSIKVESIK